jgi:UDP-N-acetylmuramate--alanine ligase
VNKLSTIQKIYFIGIGGIGMSALARYFLSKSVEVAGYDKTPTPLTRSLEAAGIAIHYEENINLIPKDVNAVVYTPAIPATHAELVYYRNHNYTVVKRSDVLQWITEASFNICVAGTHGKTTVSSMVAHILRDSDFGCNAFLGGIAVNYQTNFWSNPNNVVVVEADEYDRSFLKLLPDIAVITSMDPDHLDIYGTAQAVEDAFIEFATKIKPGGCLVSRYGFKRASELTAFSQFTYSLNEIEADVFAQNLQVVEGNYCFDVVGKTFSINDIILPMGGLHNIENALAAIIVAMHVGISADKIRAALANFKGVKRRFEYRIKTNKQVLIDDYAHHPQELRALISGVKNLYPNQPMVLVFQPHLFSRTKDQATDFAAVLDLADQVLLLPIYPARELPMEGVSSELLLDKMQLTNKQIIQKDQLSNWMQTNKPPLVVMAGAGDIDALVEPVQSILLCE